MNFRQFLRRTRFMLASGVLVLFMPVVSVSAGPAGKVPDAKASESDPCSYCVCDRGTVKPACQKCCAIAATRSTPPAALSMKDCGALPSGGSKFTAVRNGDPYPCCTECTDCRTECVATDANGNCTHWKNRCSCTKHCPCSR